MVTASRLMLLQGRMSGIRSAVSSRKSAGGDSSEHNFREYSGMISVSCTLFFLDVVFRAVHPIPPQRKRCSVSFVLWWILCSG